MPPKGRYATVSGRDHGNDNTPNESTACGQIQMRSEAKISSPPKIAILRRSRGVACLRTAVVGDLRGAVGAMAMFCVASIGIDPPRYLGGYAVGSNGRAFVPPPYVGCYNGAQAGTTIQINTRERASRPTRVSQKRTARHFSKTRLHTDRSESGDCHRGPD